MQGWIGKFAFAVFFAVAPVAANQERCLNTILDAVFLENDIGEVEAIVVLRRLELALAPLALEDRILLADQTVRRLNRELDNWEFARREYLGGILFAGPNGSLRWLSPQGCWMRARLPSNYWKNRKMDDLRFPRSQDLRRLEWELLVPCQEPST